MKILGQLLTFAELERGICKFCGSRGVNAICIIDSGGWTPLTNSKSFCDFCQML